MTVHRLRVAASFVLHLLWYSIRGRFPCNRCEVSGRSHNPLSLFRWYTSHVRDDHPEAYEWRQA